MICLVGCSVRKLDRPAPARELYQGLVFRPASEYAEMFADHWYVLSALHGLLTPDDVVRPYNLSLHGLTVAQRRRWVRLVTNQLSARSDAGPFVLLAGRAYRRLLAPVIELAEHPTDHMGSGERQTFFWDAMGTYA